MQREGNGPHLACRQKDIGAIPSRRMDDELTGMNGSVGTQGRHQTRQDIIGDRKEHEVRIDGDLGRREHRNTREQRIRPQSRQIRNGGYRGNVMTRSAQCRTQHGTDTAGTHNPHA